MQLLALDFAESLPNFRMKTFFDVGANKGQTVRRVIKHFPGARVYSFEPVTAAFDALKMQYSENGDVSCYRLALGSEDRDGLVTAVGSSTNNALTFDRSGPVEEVRVRTGDGFCTEHGIADISFLKIDTEGNDLDVLAGFEGMLREGKISLCQVECGMNATNPKHVPLHRFQEFLEPFGYHLYHLYGQRHEFKGRPMLRRADAVFISASTVAANTVKKRKR